MTVNRKIESPVVWSGKTTAYSKANTNVAFRKVWLLDAQWTDCPVEVEERIREMWEEQELRNDVSVIKTTLTELLEEPANHVIAQYILEKNPEIEDGEQILIHWWW